MTLIFKNPAYAQKTFQTPTAQRRIMATSERNVPHFGQADDDYFGREYETLDALAIHPTKYIASELWRTLSYDVEFRRLTALLYRHATTLDPKKRLEAMTYCLGPNQNSMLIEALRQRRWPVVKILLDSLETDDLRASALKSRGYRNRTALIAASDFTTGGGVKHPVETIEEARDFVKGLLSHIPRAEQQDFLLASDLDGNKLHLQDPTQLVFIQAILEELKGNNKVTYLLDENNKGQSLLDNMLRKPWTWTLREVMEWLPDDQKKELIATKMTEYPLHPEAYGKLKRALDPYWPS